MVPLNGDVSLWNSVPGETLRVKRGLTVSFPSACLRVVVTPSLGWCLNPGSCRQGPVLFPTLLLLKFSSPEEGPAEPHSPTHKSLPSPCLHRWPLQLQRQSQAWLPGLLFCSGPASPFLSRISLFSLTSLLCHSSWGY